MPLCIELMAIRVGCCRTGAAGRRPDAAGWRACRFPPSPRLRPLRGCLSLAAVALAVGAGLSACTPGPASAPSAVAGASDSAGADRLGRRRRRRDGRHRADRVDAALEPLRRAAGGPGVRDARGAAELRRPRRPEDHAGAVDGPGYRARRQAAGRAAGEPGRAGRARPVARVPGRVWVEPAGGGQLRHRRLRPARGGRLGARAELRPELLRRGHGPTTSRPPRPPSRC